MHIRGFFGWAFIPFYFIVDQEEGLSNKELLLEQRNDRKYRVPNKQKKMQHVMSVVSGVFQTIRLWGFKVGSFFC